jgi:hypothetical protein
MRRSFCRGHNGIRASAAATTIPLRTRIKLNLNHCLLFIPFSPLCSFLYSTANTGLYAHYVFNTLDKDHTGTLSFEVS